MPIKKRTFPLTYWKRDDSIISLGGYNHSQRLSEVQQFSRAKNQWTALPSLPQRISGSSATVMSEVLYRRVWLSKVSVLAGHGEKAEKLEWNQGYWSIP